MTKTRMTKLLEEDHKKLSRWARELSVIEDRKVTMIEVSHRILCGDDIPLRLKRGAEERRFGFK